RSRGQPQTSFMVLADMPDLTAQTHRCRRLEWIMDEALSHRIVAIDRVVAPHPHSAGMIHEQRRHDDVAKALGLVPLVLEHAKPITVVAIEAVLCAEPEKSAIILNDMRHSLLGEAQRARQAHKTQVISIGHR